MNLKTIILSLLVLGIMSTPIFSQSEDDGKIKVEITKEINGEKKTFKGEYNSTEEMRADPSYQEFAGDDNGFNFWFDGDGDEDVFLHLDQFGDSNKSFFKFFQDEDDEENNGIFFKHFNDDDGNSFFFKHLDSDSLEGFLDLHLDNIDMEAYKEKLKNLGIELDVLMEKLNHGNVDGSSTRIISIKRIKIGEVKDEFGKKGKVAESNKLELDELSFYPNPSSNGRFKVRFELPEEGELNIKVSNLEGKEVFKRYFERFGGTYSETIDLSDQKDGIYLLEISSGKKRLTRKIVIN